MQVISLISRDGFFLNYNVTIPTDDFVTILKSFPSVWKEDKYNHPYLENHAGNLKWKYTLKFTEILCPTGLCAVFNFNISEVYNLNE